MHQLMEVEKLHSKVLGSSEGEVTFSWKDVERLCGGGSFVTGL